MGSRRSVPVRIRLDEQQSNLWPAGTTATVVITGEKDRDASQILSSVKSPIACASLVDRYGHFSIASQHIRFAVKLACAIVLALFVGFHFQLETPRWAVLTAAIVAAGPAFAAGGEPYSGAIRYRGMLRIIGTFIGCIAALTIIILMIRTPLLMLIVCCIWAGFAPGSLRW